MSHDNAMMPAGFVLAVENCHAEACGRPPGITRGPGDGTYFGYYENEYGEQFVLVIDREKKTGVVRSGDIGWETAVEINDDEIQGDVIFGAGEFAWLALCWEAATGGKLRNSFDMAEFFP